MPNLAIPSAAISICILLALAIAPALSSVGDRSPYFGNCVRQCRKANCTSSLPETPQHRIGDPVEEYFHELFLWSCEDHCDYACMWRTTDSFVARDWKVPQFYGKWPFKRLLGMQEPASVVFSLLNFIANWRGIQKFRTNVRRDSPMFYVWHVFCAICLNGWIWSTVFHIRDYPLTELLDYSFAYSMVLASFTCMLLRIFHAKPIIMILVSIGSVFFFLNHFALLSVGKFDYGYNMKANVVTGLLGGSGWMLWYFLQPRRSPYAWKMCVFQLLAAASLSLELMDFAPIWWTFDAHALWHLATVPLTVLLYSFIIDDCNALRNTLLDIEAKRLV